MPSSESVLPETELVLIVLSHKLIRFIKVLTVYYRGTEYYIYKDRDTLLNNRKPHLLSTGQRRIGYGQT